MTPSIAKQLTLCVKTFQRPACLERLLHSIRERYSDIPVIVADDGPGHEGSPAAASAKAVYLPLPFDSGLSVGRNRMLDAVSTPYAAILDDDFVFVGATNMAQLIEPLVEGQYDLMAGRLFIPGSGHQHYEGFMSEHRGCLVMARVTSESLLIPAHIVLNFFAARAESLRTVRWDEALKVYEHEDFFWRAKAAGVRVGYDPRVVAHHIGERPGNYAVYRNGRIAESRAYVLRKHGWSDIRWVML